MGAGDWGYAPMSGLSQKVDTSPDCVRGILDPVIMERVWSFSPVCCHPHSGNSERFGYLAFFDSVPCRNGTGFLNIVKVVI